MKPVIKIAVVSDVVCPWCYIGEARLQKAMNQVKDQFSFEITYHPFELNPYMPEEGKPTEEHYAEKFGGADRMHQIFERTAGNARAEGLPFDLTKQKTSPNTFKAHRLIAYAKSKGKQLEMVHNLFVAYFADGANLSETNTLVRLAIQSGLDEEKTRHILSGDDFTGEVSEAQLQWRKLGITSVPSFIIQNKYLVQGAQAPESFIEVFKEITPEITKAQGCDDDGCEI